MIDGSSYWVIGRNATSACNIEHIARTVLALPDGNDHITMINGGFHICIPAERFYRPSICASTVEVVDD